MPVGLNCLCYLTFLLASMVSLSLVAVQLPYVASYAYTTKSEYGVGETIVLGLRNIGNSTLYLSSAPGPWVILTRNTLQAVYHNPSYLEVLVPIEPGSNSEWTWNQKDDGGRQVDTGRYLFEVGAFTQGFQQYLYFYAEFTISHPHPTVDAFDVKFRGLVTSIESPCCDRGTFENITVTYILIDPSNILEVGDNITVQYCGPCLLPGDVDVEPHNAGDAVEVFGSYQNETGWVTLARSRPDHYVHKTGIPLSLAPLAMLSMFALSPILVYSMRRLRPTL